jgi:hypothetical protein
VSWCGGPVSRSKLKVVLKVVLTVDRSRLPPTGNLDAT